MKPLVLALLILATGLLAFASCQQQADRAEEVLDETIKRITERTNEYVECIGNLDVSQVSEALALLEQARALTKTLQGLATACQAPADPAACGSAMKTVVSEYLVLAEAAKKWCPASG